MESDISKTEIFIINRYAASELAGSIWLGKMARKADDAILIKNLTWHCMEEARHAFVWQNLINRLEIPLMQIHDEDGENYFSQIDKVNNMIEFLAFTHIFEHRVPFHFSMHLKWTKNEAVKEILEKLIPEETPHLAWIENYLKEEIDKGNNNIKQSLDTFKKLEKEIYYKDLEKLERMSDSGKEFVQIIKNNIRNFEKIKKWWENEK